MGEPNEDEIKNLTEAFKALGTWPKVDTPQDLVKWMQSFAKITAPQDNTDPSSSSASTPSSHAASSPPSFSLSQAPKIPAFSGEKKGETSFEVWKYHVNCLTQNGSISPQTVASTVQQSLRGRAATIAMCLGPEADVKQLIAKLDSIFGSVDQGQSLLGKFYSARQDIGEDIATWACRLEYLLNQATQQTPIPTVNRADMMRNQVWSGSRPELRDLSAHTFDTGGSFEDLLRILRRSEADLQQRGTGSHKKSSAPSMAAVASTDPEMSEIKGMLKQLSSDVAMLKKQQDKPRYEDTGYQQPASSYQAPRPEPVRRPNPRQKPSVHWSDSTETQPTTRYESTGWTQDQRPHRQDDTEEPICFRCKQPGHLQYGCRVRLDHSRSLNRNRPMPRGRP